MSTLLIVYWGGFLKIDTMRQNERSFLKALDGFSMYMLARTRSEYRGMKMGIAFSEFSLFSLHFFVCRCQNDDHKDKSPVSGSIYLWGGGVQGRGRGNAKD